jgi:hypothetical protein
LLAIALDQPTRRSRWSFEINLDDFTRRGGVLTERNGGEE